MYDMYDISFNGVHSWNDLYLIPLERPVIPPPEVKTNLVDIPGGNGSIDLTNALTGEPCYKDRTGSIEFMVVRKNMDLEVYKETTGQMIRPDLSALNAEVRYDPWTPDHPGDPSVAPMYWVVRYREIMESIHGVSGPMIYSEDPSCFYKGRFSVSDWKTGDTYSTVSVNFIASPFRYSTDHLGLYGLPELEQYGVL